jgi:integrase
VKLTQANVDRLKLPAGKSETIEFDDDCPGFGIRIRASGGRSWIFQYRQGDKQRRVTFGAVGAMTAPAARAQATKFHAEVRLGRDPQAEKAEHQAHLGETFQAVAVTYLERQRAALRPRSFVEVQRHILKAAKPFHLLPLDQIDRRTIAMRVAELANAGGPTAANCARATWSSFFAWAIREGITETNPVIGANKAHETSPRTRVLSDPELAAIWRALPEVDDFGDVVRILALTGQRRQEIGGLRWSEVDFDKALITLPPERTKNGLEHVVPMSSAVLDIIKRQPRADRHFVFGRGDGGFKGFSSGKLVLDAKLQLAPWVFHDLRRTFSTKLHDDLGVAPHIVEALINHVSGHRAGVAGVYNKAQYTAPKAQAMASWAAHLLEIVEGREAGDNVTPLLRANVMT